MTKGVSRAGRALIASASIIAVWLLSAMNVGNTAESKSASEPARNFLAQRFKPKPGARGPAPTCVNVKYGSHERNVLDVWLAKSDKPTPLMIYIHGGGFVNGDKAAGAGRAAEFLAQGVSFASINYRFLAQASLPDIMRDGARAVQFLRSKASEWNIDPNRIGAFGGSAGAGMSLWLGAHDDLANPTAEDPVLRQSTRLKVVGMMNGQATYDVAQWPKLIGPPPTDSEARAVAKFKGPLDSSAVRNVMKEVDMLGMLTKDDPPVFLYCSNPDKPAASHGEYVHHPRHAKVVEARCKELGIDALFVGIGKDGSQASVEFFVRHLKSNGKSG